MKLSIIIPFFNAASTLERCIISIRSEAINDMELLLVDDGSADGSGKMADAYAEKYSFIRVFHKDNKGPSAARNVALDKAKGDFIMFVDSDDELSPGTIRHLINRMEAHPECYILEFPAIERPGMNNQHIFNPGEKVYECAFDWLSEHGFEHSWVWNKVYRREIFNNIRFAEGRIYEDILLLEHIIKLNPRIETTSEGAYIYNWNEDGLVSQSSKKGFILLLEAQIHVVKALNIDTRKRQWHRLYINMLTAQLHAYRQTGRILLAPQRVSVRKYTSINDIIKALFLNTIGLRNMCKLFAIL